MRHLAVTLVAACGLTGIVIALHASPIEADAFSLKSKDRVAADYTSAPRTDYGATLIELAQVARPAAAKANYLPGSGTRDTRPQLPEGEFSGPERSHLPFGPQHPPRSMRAACIEEINISMAMAGYIKSRLNLRAAQKELWRKLEDAAESRLDDWRKSCGLLPEQGGASLSFPDMVAADAERMAARAELLVAVREPLGALYAILTADQREMLTRALPPLPGPPPDL